MTPQQLAEIEQRWEKATPGPWQTDGSGIRTGHKLPGVYEYKIADIAQNHRNDNFANVWQAQVNDAQAISNAPTDIQALLAEVRRLNLENIEARKVVDATRFYMAHINSPLCVGWDNLLDVLQGWRKYLESEVADNG